MEDVRVFNMFGFPVRIGWSEARLREELGKWLSRYFFDSEAHALRFVPWHQPKDPLLAGLVVARIKEGKIASALIVCCNVIHYLEDVDGEINDETITDALHRYGAHPDYFTGVE